MCKKKSRNLKGFCFRCKLFYKKDSEFKEKGVGTLHLKLTAEKKTQMLIRAHTNLGTFRRPEQGERWETSTTHHTFVLGLNDPDSTRRSIKQLH